MPINRQFPGLNIFQNTETFSLPTIPLPSPLPFLFSLLPFLPSFFVFEKNLFVRWDPLIAQLVKNPPAMKEMLVQFLGREDLLEKE